MGQGTHRVSTPEELEREIAAIRAGMEPLLRELDRRRHEAVDRWTRIGRRVPRVAGWAGTLAAVVSVVRTVRRIRARRRGETWAGADRGEVPAWVHG